MSVIESRCSPWRGSAPGRRDVGSTRTLKAEMIDASRRLWLMDVPVLAATNFTLTCRIGGKFVRLPSSRTLPGTDISRRGDRGRLILQRAIAQNPGLCK